MSAHTEGCLAARRPGAAGRGFTLIELLVVVAIIGILVAILLPAIYGALTTSADAVIKVEIKNLDAAVESFRTKYGIYPPDFTNPTQVQRAVARMFPRNVDPIPTGLTRAQALVFWLRGFGPDPQRPFTSMPRTPLFQFDEARLIGPVGSNQTYNPRGCDAPYVYFEASTYPTAVFAGIGEGVARPYRSGLPATVWANPTSFQIVSAGRDNHYGDHAGNPGVMPTPANPSGQFLGDTDRDNVVNFNTSTTIGDDLP